MALPNPAAPPREDVKKIIAEICKQAFPLEACGFVVRRGAKIEIVPCQNVSLEPREQFRIRPEDFEAVEDSGGEIEIVWHSHPNGRAAASPADKTMVEELKIPYLIYATPADLWDFYAPTGYKADLIGRPFVHGVLDCYSLVRDYYAEKLQIDLPDFYRPDDWWMPKLDEAGKVVEPALNLYVDNFAKAGFVQVARPAKHDGILMRIAHHRVSHAGIYLGDGMMLHHPQKSVSRVIPFRLGTSNFYVRSTEGFYRHKSLISSSSDV